MATAQMTVLTEIMVLYQFDESGKNRSSGVILK